MKKFILLFLLFSLNLTAQKIDSLLRLINSPKATVDTLMCLRYLELIDLESNINIWKKYNYKLGHICNSKLKSKISTQEKAKYLNLLGIYFNNLGLISSNENQLASAEKYYHWAAKIHKFTKDDARLALAYQNLAIIQVRKGEPSQNIFYAKKALQISEKLKDSSRIASIYGDIGYVNAENGAENLGIEYFMKAINICDKINDEDTKMRTIEYLVKTLRVQKENEKALKYLKILNTYFKKNNDLESLSLNYYALASVHNDLKNTKEMFANINKSLSYALKENYNGSKGANYGLLAKYYITNMQYDSAYKYSFKEIETRKISNVEPALTKSTIRYVSILNFKKEYKKAIELGKENLKKAKEISNLDMIISAANNLMVSYEKLNNKAKAFEYANMVIKAKDSLNNINTKNYALKSIFKYETEAKDNQLVKAEQQKQISELNSKRKNLIIYSILGAILAIAIIAYFTFTKYKTKKENELLLNQLQEAETKLILEQKATESELKALKSQMNPHFMFNALNSIQEQFMYGNKLLANEQMGNFTDLTRKILTVSGKKKITIATEIDILTKYLELEKMRFTNEFNYEIIVGQNIDEQYHQIPPMLIQPFVENSIKHGLMHKSGAKNITVKFELSENENKIICEIEDNGIGREKSAELKQKNTTNHESFSILATQERLKMINTNEIEKDLLVFKDLKNENNEPIGTKVKLKIELT